MYFFVLYFIIFFPHVYGFTHTKSPKIIKEFEKLSRRIISDCGAPGAAVAIVMPERIVSLQTYGVCQENGLVVDQNTLFRVGSLSKICSSALVAKLDTDGILSLKSPIKEYMPLICISDPAHTNRIKVEHLLSHTSGIAAYSLENKAYHQHNNFHELLCCLPTTRRVSDPGKVFQYQNVVFSLIAPVVLSATGYSFTKNVQEKLLNPLDIHCSLTDEAYWANSNAAFPHLRAGSTHRPFTGRSYYDNILPAGGMAFSIEGIAKLVQAFIGGYPSVLDEKTLDKIFYPRIFVKRGFGFCRKKSCSCKESIREHYGLGCRIISSKINNKLCIMHYGRVTGFTSGFAFSPSNKIGIVVLTNSDLSPIPYLLIQYFFKMIHGSSVSVLNESFDRWNDRWKDRISLK
jgi:beta-lactamase class C